MEMNAEYQDTRVSARDIPEEYFAFKTRIHDRLLDLIDLSLVDSIDTEVLRY
jgi:pilus assembly protein CpaF